MREVVPAASSRRQLNSASITIVCVSSKRGLAPDVVRTRACPAVADPRVPCWHPAPVVRTRSWSQSGPAARRNLHPHAPVVRTPQVPVVRTPQVPVVRTRSWSQSGPAAGVICTRRCPSYAPASALGKPRQRRTRPCLCGPPASVKMHLKEQRPAARCPCSAGGGLRGSLTRQCGGPGALAPPSSRAGRGPRSSRSGLPLDPRRISCAS